MTTLAPPIPFVGSQLGEIRHVAFFIIGGILQENPFYAPPQEFRREYRQRREVRTAAPSPLA
jgi:hypothetical protein